MTIIETQIKYTFKSFGKASVFDSLVFYPETN